MKKFKDYVQQSFKKVGGGLGGMKDTRTYFYRQTAFTPGLKSDQRKNKEKKNSWFCFRGFTLKLWGKNVRFMSQSNKVNKDRHGKNQIDEQRMHAMRDLELYLSAESSQGDAKS